MNLKIFKRNFDFISATKLADQLSIICYIHVYYRPYFNTFGWINVPWENVVAVSVYRLQQPVQNPISDNTDVLWNSQSLGKKYSYRLPLVL